MPVGKCQIFLLSTYSNQLLNYIERIDRCCKCCARVPSSSLLAFIMLICGLGLLTGSLVTVGERLKKNELLNYNEL